MARKKPTSSPTPNLFDKAKKSSTKAKGKKQLPRVEVTDLNTYAALVAAQKTIESLLETMKDDIYLQVIDHVVAQNKPDSFEGFEEKSTANLQLRKRSTRSYLNDQEMKLLNEADIEYEKSSESKFYINPEYAENQDLLNKVSVVLDGVVPDDFFLHTGDKYTTTKQSIPQAFRVKDGGIRRRVLDIVGVPAARTKFGGTHKEMIEILEGVLD